MNIGYIFRAAEIISKIAVNKSNMTQTKVKVIKGMADILPDQAEKHKLPPISFWQALEEALRKLMVAYNYSEIRFPILESTLLFKRSLGEATDVVAKEMFTFIDSDEQVSLRPEGTAGCVRACIDAGLLRNQQQQRVWYMGPMFRREQPQYGRYRQFYQFGAEAFGVATSRIDAEQLQMIANLWRELAIDDEIRLEINSIGGINSRAKFKQDLVRYFSKYKAQLDADSQTRLVHNPLRILDSKNPHMQELIAGAPRLLDYLDDQDKRHFDQLLAELDLLGVTYRVNPYIVRGLDYYNRTVYEWVTDKLGGAQNAVCAGGRYDSLSELLAGPATPAVGFAIGIDRVLLLMQALDKRINVTLDGYLVCVGEAAEAKSLQLAEFIRVAYPGLSLLINFGGGSFKSQFKKADKSGARLAFIIGENELAQNQVTIKFLREEREQVSVAMAKLAEYLVTVLRN